ncbi:MAG: type II toxin-antitoxin system RelE/ParE family toxin [Desulfobacula sp.]|jgi:mRNA interferase RelE/StbE|uniref:type II toxin-antitoxin system RelE family toxin n=1 Tax=Desulfobacula sp. TaxID=2593537 RepID=UPI001DB9A425|nr:type II toxin-antitoxin system RelE/ParE family toxin [Desulfobacula sp.]MBT3807284.1 type II toxin-antitoxin system RelE/ParE family toxin [Desulfobacula sp.]MBT4200565.1 type II toxin-antitoxin system RelE/ParE family toxin [Desulfobacula sp.]MBT5546532.1 type II toxin-antitoxin system RelE/ParE family toxin [Desulfobacula sp.]MBT5973737.1 type II toxin-antitoxin system RelE/ParE family toxin [Desulfobacula sp.]
MLKLDLTKKARAFLDKLPPKQFKQVAKKIFSLMADPEPHDSKELKGYPYRGTDIGEYRIIYRLEENVLKIVLVGKRNDSEVYKKMTRL